MSLVSGIQYSTEIIGRRNAVINGDFDIWQRGTSQTADGIGSADRWYNGVFGTTQVASQQTFTLGQIDVPNNPKYYSRVVVTSSAGVDNYCSKGQLVEGVQTFAGEAVTLSFWAKADANKNIAIEFRQGFGTGGTPSALVHSIEVTTVSLTTSWAKHTVTITLPSISGKTLGTDGNDFLFFHFWFDAGSNWNSRTNSLGQQSGTFDIAQVQLEKGDAVTEFERRSYGEELALCQRYYQQSTSGSFTSNDNSKIFENASPLGHTSVFRFTWAYPVVMRTSPALTLYSTDTGTSGNIYNQTLDVDISAIAKFVGDSSFVTSNESGSTVAANTQLRFHWTADAEL